MMDNAQLLNIIITAVVTALSISIIGGGIGYLWWKLKKTDSYVTREECKNCAGQRFADMFRAEINNFRKELREDISKLRDLLIKHIQGGGQGN